MTLSQRAEFNALRERYINELKPAGPEQEAAAEQLAQAAWALRVLEREEAEIFRAYSDPYRNKKAQQLLRQVTAMRSHYAKSHQAAGRLFLLLSRRRAARRRTRSGTPQNNGER